MNREQFLKKLRQEIPYIKACEEDDWDWYNEEIELVERGNLERAEKKFKELILSQPDHHDGYEGLAKVYMKMGRLEDALFLIEEAIELAGKFLEDGSLDIEILEELKQLRESIRK